MNLNELRAAFDTEARRKAKAFNDENRHLKNVIEKKDERILRLEKSLRGMYVKCYNATAAAVPVCEGCDQRGRCRKMRKEAGEVRS